MFDSHVAIELQLHTRLELGLAKMSTRPSCENAFVVVNASVSKDFVR